MALSHLFCSTDKNDDLKPMAIPWTANNILHTFPFETELQYFVLDSLEAEV